MKLQSWTQPKWLSVHACICIFYLHRVLVATHRIFDLRCSMQTLSCGTWDLVPCQRSNSRPVPLHHQGSPNNIIFWLLLRLLLSQESCISLIQCLCFFDSDLILSYRTNPFCGKLIFWEVLKHLCMYSQLESHVIIKLILYMEMHYKLTGWD